MLVVGYISIVSMRFSRLVAVLLVACQSEEGARDHRADSGPVRSIDVAGTLLEQALNAPSKSVNRTSWQGVAKGAYVRFALYGDGLGTIADAGGSAATDFSWEPSGGDSVTCSGNPWFDDLTIIEFSDTQTFIATSASGGVFGRRWDLADTMPLW